MFALRGEGAPRERPRAAAQLDPTGLDELMTFWAPLAPRTMFKGVNQLGPGEMLILENDGVHAPAATGTGNFPSAAAHRRDDRRTSSKSELRRRARRRHADPLARRRARGRLSVGRPRFLDAGGVAQGARAATRCDTFSIGFDDAGLDESAHQRTVVRASEDRSTTTCSARSPTSPAMFPRTIRHTESRSCARRPRRCSCCRAWCAART